VRPGKILQLSASDVSNHLSCGHLTALDLLVAQGELEAPIYADAGLEALRERGFQHETAYVAHLKLRGVGVVAIGENIGHGKAAEETVRAMQAGADAILQATLTSERWMGRADVLLRVEAPSKLGAWSYEVHDTKLARETRGGAVLQLCLYSELVGGIQGCLPERMCVVRPGTEYVPDEYRTVEYLAYYRQVCRSLEEAVSTRDVGLATYPEPCQMCDVCVWQVNCDRRRREDDHLSLVAGISRQQRRELREHGVGTLKALSEMRLPLAFKPDRGSREGYERVREQARVQVEARETSKPIYELLSYEEGRGLGRLPEPSAGDIFLDLEGDPFIGDAGREYLLGYVADNGDGDAAYQGLWGFAAEEEKAAFERLMDEVTLRLEAHPDLHIYHFAPYEPAALKRLMGRYATREDELDQLLRAERFVDLHAVVRQGLRAGIEKYSIKDLEAFYGFKRETPLWDANTQRHALQYALELQDEESISEEMRRTVEEYNREDCVSTLYLRDWLEELRAGVVAAGQEIPRPELKPGDPSEALSEAQQRVRDLMGRLMAGIPAAREERSDEQHAQWLLAQMLEWHRREDKATWWEYFRLFNLAGEEMLDERNGLGGLEFVQPIESSGRTPVHRYTFPVQECAIRAGQSLHTSETENTSYGSVVVIDAVARTIDIKKRGDTADLHATTAFAHDHVRAGVLKDALLRLGEWVADFGIDEEGPWRSACDLLLGRPPRLRDAAGDLQRDGEAALDAARRLVCQLDGGVLPIQGPPGSGKTYAGARMVCELVRAGKKVGITAVSHKVIRNLVEEVVSAAAEEGLELRCCQKVSEVSAAAPPAIIEVTDNGSVLDALVAGTAQVGAGTAWMWSRDEYENVVDVLFVDEAGQMSLANVLAVSSACRSLVLLGDPQQLEQPQQGSHPDGTGVSALEHILGDLRTIPGDRGLFLAETWRLHPAICSFTSELFYDGRLRPREARGLERQALLGDVDPVGSGLWFAPVEHEGNVNASDEEADRVADLARSLSGRAWLDRDGSEGRIRKEDILIVAPYNAQVAEIQGRLPEWRVGTVDRFQGQEAPIVIYSMTTSLPEDAPRGMDFLYNLSRLNVATSRAQCTVILVANPKLLEPECRSPKQMRLANAFCRYVEMAKVIG
jgi:predicted RecB family nuclease